MAKNYSRAPILSLEPSVKVFEVRLIFNLPAGKGVRIESLKLSKPHCEVIICNEKHLQGECVQFSSSLPDVSVQDKKVHLNVKSVDCHCAEEPEVPPTSSTEPELSSVDVIKNEKIQSETPCSTIYREWHYKGQSHQATSPGSVGKIDLGSTQQIRSVSVKTGCTLMLWGPNGPAGDEVVSFSISNSTSFLKMKSADNFDWACCYCDECSESVCKNSQASSKFLERERANHNLDFSQFVKYGRKIIGIGRNYRWKKVELAKLLEIPKQPIVFLKPVTSYITEGQLIELPESLGTIFYELELGVVIGKRARNISETQALDHVAGYFLALDMTAKEFLKRSVNQSLPWEIGKGYDTACPVGNFVPKLFIPDPNNMLLECKVNGEVTQSENTSQMIFNVQQLISYVSKYMTLEPYDVILTGTPDGFGPLRPGDVVEGRLGNITSITFTAVAS
ncbi:Acylpyruvase FAHD1, mitochondrial [Orchesella cincta]|uniref:oxaloacetate tautomerase n=1 Tax=Orchesella cincta TaxID=48709 RepID=A0A1D2N7M7_ORCCI|nr:Acylpyruvase FAHD1, mitochondrial [Orchesella cincta]